MSEALSLAELENKERKLLVRKESLEKELLLLTTQLLDTQLAISTVKENLKDFTEEQDPELLVLKGDQPKAKERILSWLSDPKAYQLFAFMGVAGSGKSTLVKNLVKSKELSKYEVHLTATTNKAAATLSEITGSPVKTIHSLLGLTMDEDGEEVKLKPPDKEVIFSSREIIVVDEGSMANTELTKYILATRTKVLIIGDNYQLPPVGELKSPLFKLCRDNESYVMMRQVLRFDSDLINMSVALRNCITTKNYSSPLKTMGDQVSVFDSKDDFYNELLKDLSVDKFKQTKIIAWRNKTVDEYNSLVRNELGFSREFELGESLFSASPIYDDADNLIGSVDTDLFIENLEVVQRTISIPGLVETTIESYKLTVSGGYKGTVYIAKDKNGYTRYTNYLASLAKNSSGFGKKEAWRKFWKFKHSFILVRYGYAMTAHRSQGSSYDSVFVDQRDILVNKDKITAFKCLYVACTRPRRRLYSF